MERITQIQVILSIGRDLSRKSHGGLYIHIILYYIILNLPQFTNDLQIHLKYMY